VNKVTQVDLLLGAYFGTSFDITFAGSGGATETFNNIGVPDFNGGGPINTTGTDTASIGSYSDQTVFRVTDVGAGGSGNSSNGDYNNYDLLEVSFTLAGAFNSQSLSTFDISSNGNTTLLLGATAVSPSAAPAPESSTAVSFGLMAALGLGVLAIAAKRKAVV
jgi:hypothetical protein